MNHTTTIEHFLHHLEAAGKRSTPQRYAVCQALIKHRNHPTAADIFAHVRDMFPMISQATVYNTLETLEQLGLVQRFGIVNDEHMHYEISEQAHVNIVCTCCASIQDVHIRALEDILTHVSQDTGYSFPQQQAIVVYGTCGTCREKLRSTA